MRLNFRIVLLALLVVAAPAAFASHYTADCPVTLVGATAPTSEMFNSPHGVFKNGSVIYMLRGETLTTLNVSDVGEVDIARQDRIASLAGREKEGGVTYGDGILYVSSEHGLEVFDLRNVHGGANGEPPSRISHTITPHYNRLTVNGNVLAALYSGLDLPCTPGHTPGCTNYIDLYSIADLAAPLHIARINSGALSSFVAFNDIAFVNGFLFSTGFGGTHVFNVSDAAAPTIARIYPTRGNFLVTNGSNLLGIGQETLIGVFFVGPGTNLSQHAVYTLPSIMDHSNPLMFHPEAAFDDNNHLITMIDEKNPMTGKSARTVAFDVFDMTIPLWNGYDDRLYENVSLTDTDEVKWDPLAVGPFIYVNGEVSGAQTYGACGQMAGELELGLLGSLPCGGAEIHGWVTGAHKITDVEVYLDNSSLGHAALGRERADVSSKTPVTGWSVVVNLDQVTRGEHLFRVVATDVMGNTRQIHSKQIFFNGPGQNCTTRKRIRR